MTLQNLRVVLRTHPRSKKMRTAGRLSKLLAWRKVDWVTSLDQRKAAGCAARAAVLQCFPLVRYRSSQHMSSNIRLRLFLMMVLEFVIWGAWLPLIYNYLPSLKFSPAEQSWILNAFPISAIVGIFFS